MQGTIRKLGGNGDTAVVYDLEVEEAVKAAEKVFDEAKASGHLMVNGVTNEQMLTFDPTATEILDIPAVVGG